MLFKIKFFLYRLGLLRSKKGIRVLTYHGVVDAITKPKLQRNFHTTEQFEEHLSLLKKNKFKLINASELLFYINNPHEIKRKKLACITFDDGYENNLKAIEILKKNNGAGIFFVSTETIDSDVSIWTVNLSLLFLEGTISELLFEGTIHKLSNLEERFMVFQQIRAKLKNENAVERTRMYDSIIKQFPANEIERLIQDNNYFKMLNWNQMMQVKDDNIQFQSHGHKHEIHNEYQNIKTITNELSKSKQIIENHLNSKVSLFAYPNGNSNEISIEALKNTGYEAAFILKETCYNGVDNKFLIPRFTPKGNKYKFLKQILFT